MSIQHPFTTQFSVNKMPSAWIGCPGCLSVILSGCYFPNQAISLPRLTEIRQHYTCNCIPRFATVVCQAWIYRDGLRSSEKKSDGP
ncbi:hypothetical protein BDD12DRAFT_846352 [Trichophaea hybrida]|nr:hypothetical protein BDD12DRAFT_846352 [Trichophaea hybrida]